MKKAICLEIRLKIKVNNRNQRFGTLFDIRKKVLVKFKDKIGKATFYESGFFVYN